MLAPVGRIQPVLAKVEPVLAREQARGPASSAYCRRCRRARRSGSRSSARRRTRRKRLSQTHDHDPFPWRSIQLDARASKHCSLRSNMFRCCSGARLQSKRTTSACFPHFNARPRAVARPARPLRRQRRASSRPSASASMPSSRLLLRWHPQLGNFLAYVVAIALGYFLHSSCSFKGHGARRTHVDEAALPRSSR